jgi:hypothetical protein
MINQMLAWIPQADKKTGEQQDFARLARTTMGRMERSITVALSRLTELKLALDQRNSNLQPKTGEPLQMETIA